MGGADLLEAAHHLIEGAPTLCTHNACTQVLASDFLLATGMPRLVWLAIDQ
jgi:hypothetical protein